MYLFLIFGLAVSSVYYSSCKDGFLTASPDPKKKNADANLTTDHQSPLSSPRVVDDKETDWGGVDIDKNGVLRAKLIVSLDYFPKTSPNQASLPLCRGGFDPELELGILSCELMSDSLTDREVETTTESKPPGEYSEGGTLRTVTIKAKNVFQECYTVPEHPVVMPAVPIRFSGCARGRVLGHNFSPKVRIDIEKKM